MAKNIRYDRAMAVPLPAPYAVSSGQGVQVGRIFGVALANAASGETVAVHRGGVAELPKATGQAWTVGQAVYWDDTNRVCTTTAGTNLLIGAVFEAAVSAATTGWVLLDGAVRP